MTALFRGLIGLGLLTAGIALGRWTTPASDPPGSCPEMRSALVAEISIPRSWEATVYLPLADNQGSPFTEEHWHEALEILVRRFGGATLGDPREGCWFDASRRMQRERNRPVVVTFASHRLEEFRQAIHEVGQFLGQEAMYVRFDEARVDLIAVTLPSPCRVKETISPN